MIGGAPLGAQGIGGGEGAAPVSTVAIAVAFAGSGDLTVVATEFVAVTFTGSGDLTVDARDSQAVRVAFAGSGSLSVAVPPSFTPGRVQTVTIPAGTGATLFYLEYRGRFTPDIPVGATAAEVEAALENDPLGALDVDVTGPPGGPWSVVFVSGREDPAPLRVGLTDPAPGDLVPYVTVVPAAARRRLVLVRQDGTPIAGELVDARLADVTWSLNETDSWSAALPSSSPQAPAVFAERLREVQVWLGDALLTWGPVVRPAQDDGGTLGLNGKGADWYFVRRHVGKADRTNYLANGSFEDGIAGWRPAANTVNNFYGDDNAAPPPTTGIVSFPTLTGDRAVRLSQSVAGADTWLGQTFVFASDPDENPDGDVWTFRAYVWLEPGWLVETAYEDRGLVIARYSTTELDPDPRVQAVNPGQKRLLEFGNVTLDPDLPTSQWVGMEYALTVTPTGAPETVDCRLYAPGVGQAVWDAGSLTKNETERYRGVDQAEIIRRLGEHLQDAAYDKSFVNVGFDCPPTGVLRSRDYVHAEHPNGWSSIAEFASLRDGVDLSMAYGATTRTLRTHFPAKGKWRPNRRLSYGVNFGAYSFASDGEAAATSVIALGEGSGSDREEGFALDASGYAEAVTLEEVYSPGPDTPVDALDDRAAERLAVAREPDLLTVTTFPSTPLLGRVEVGDWCPVDLYDGGLAIAGVTYRIVRMSLNEDDSLTMTLNRRDVLA